MEPGYSFTVLKHAEPLVLWTVLQYFLIETILERNDIFNWCIMICNHLNLCVVSQNLQAVVEDSTIYHNAWIKNVTAPLTNRSYEENL